MKIAIVLGTRPEIIKMSPIIRECEKNNLDYYILHTGQHYSYKMDRIFFKQLELPKPQYNLEIGSGTHAEQTGKMIVSIEEILQHDPATIVLVQGDTNTVLAGAITSSKLGIKVGHVEAGLRSYDRTMPEELNRIIADHTSDFLFAPTSKSKDILIREGIQDNKIFMTGNTIVDAVQQHLPLIERKTKLKTKLDISKKEFLLATIHRQENVDQVTRFQNIIEGLNLVQEAFGYPIIYPVHPRAKKELNNQKIAPGKLTLIDPLDYFEFLQLERDAKLILTDSGGVQEEACILGTPCVTLRDNTERPETLEINANILAGTQPRKILGSVKFMLRNSLTWKNPFGDGTAGKKIIQILRKYNE
jgi:UDP-N-acetylglucosamine 2-epimerase (non-hydrolysing)